MECQVSQAATIHRYASQSEITVPAAVASPSHPNTRGGAQIVAWRDYKSISL
jgi:hypothetical protein